MVFVPSEAQALKPLLQNSVTGEKYGAPSYSPAGSRAGQARLAANALLVTGSDDRASSL